MVSLSSFNVTNPPSTRQFTITFTTMYQSGGVYYNSDTLTIPYNCLAGVITTASVGPYSYVINAITTYTINFTTINSLTTGSKVIVTLPAYVTANTANYCNCNITSSSCIITSSSTITVTLGQTLTAASSVQINVASVTNPGQVLKTDSFAIATYYDSGMDSLVDSISSGLTITTVANPIFGMAVNPTSLVTGVTCNYVFTATLNDPIPQGGSLTISFPPSVTVGSPMLLAASFSIDTCILTPTSSTVTLTGCFATAIMSTLAVSITLSGITNPPSLQPTTSFGMSTTGTAGPVNSIANGVFLTMYTAATSPVFTFRPVSTVVHSSSQYNLAITFACAHASGDYVLITLPNSMIFVNSPTLGCTATSGATVSCTMLSTTQAQITFTSTPSSSIAVSVVSVRNYDVSGVSVSFSMTISNSEIYLMESGTTTASYTATSLTASVASNDQIALNEVSTLTVSVTTPFTLDSSFNLANTHLVLIVPVEFTMSSTSGCSTASGTCTITLPSTLTISTIGLGLTNSLVVITKVLLPSFSVSTSFQLSFNYNGNPVAAITSGVTVVPFCTSPCQRCSGTATICSSCLPSPNTLIYLDNSANTCLAGCVSTMYANALNVCVACVPPCATCTGLSSCITCVSGNWYNPLTSLCASSCLDKYYKGSSGVCVGCTAPCANCVSSSVCTSCVTDYYSAGSCVVASACPAGTYGDSRDPTNLVCSLCT